MEFLGVIMGFTIGIYLMEIESGHLVTKKILTALERHTSHPEG
jgi:hypothetical protein